MDAVRIERQLKLNDLRVLAAVVEAGSMNRAVARLSTSQPAISKTITDLEHLLGVKLLDRSRQGVVPTPYGEALLRRSTTVFDELRMGLKDMQFLSDPLGGEVRIVAPGTLAAGIVTA